MLVVMDFMGVIFHSLSLGYRGKSDPNLTLVCILGARGVYSRSLFLDS